MKVQDGAYGPRMCMTHLFIGIKIAVGFSAAINAKCCTIHTRNVWVGNTGKIRELHRCSEDLLQYTHVPEFSIVVLWNSVVPLCIESFVCIVCRKHKTMLDISAENKLTNYNN